MPYIYSWKSSKYKIRTDLQALINFSSEISPLNNDSIIVITDDFKKWNSQDFQTIETHIEYFKANPQLGINLFYSSTNDYFRNIIDFINISNISYPTQEKYTDFFPLIGLYDKSWVGLYTTRPNLKFMVRRFGLLARSLKTMLTIRGIKNIKKIISKDLYEKCVYDMDLHIGFLTHHDTVTGTLSQYSENDVKNVTFKHEASCKKSLENLEQNYNLCYLLDNNYSCILDIFESDQTLKKEFQEEKKNISLKLFNPSQSKKDIISFRIPDINMKVFSIDGTSVDSDTFCEMANGLECFLYLRMQFHGFEFNEIILNRKISILIELRSKSTLVKGLLSI